MRNTYESYHRRCVDASLPSFVLLNGVPGGTLRAALVVAPVPAPAAVLMPLPVLRLVPALAFVLGDDEGDDVGGGRSSTGGKRSLSISDLRLRTAKSDIIKGLRRQWEKRKRTRHQMT